MADFGGFQVQTPQEVLAEQQALRQKVFSGAPVAAQRSFNIEQALDGLFGNPQMRAATRTQTAIAAAQKGVKKLDGESDLDYNIRQLSAVRDAVADTNPDVASQINARLLQLGEAKFQRNRLTAADTREQGEYDMKKQDFDATKGLRSLTGSLTYIYNPQTQKAQSFDLNNPEDAAAFEQAKAQPGNVALPAQTVAQIYMNNDDNLARMREALSKATGSLVTYRQVEGASAGLIDTYKVADRLFDVLKQNKDVLTVGSAGAAEFDKAAKQLGALSNIGEHDKTSDGTPVDSLFEQYNITTGRAKSLVFALAAAQAKMNNPDGRISDNDMRIALQMVGGDNANPNVLLANINDRLKASTSAILTRVSDQPELAEKFKGRAETLRQEQAKFDDNLHKFIVTPAQNAAAGTAAPTQSADGWTTLPNGVRIREKK